MESTTRLATTCYRKTSQLTQHLLKLKNKTKYITCNNQITCGRCIRETYINTKGRAARGINETKNK